MPAIADKVTHKSCHAKVPGNTQPPRGRVSRPMPFPTPSRMKQPLHRHCVVPTEGTWIATSPDLAPASPRSGVCSRGILRGLAWLACWSLWAPCLPAQAPDPPWKLAQAPLRAVFDKPSDRDYCLVQLPDEAFEARSS